MKRILSIISHFIRPDRLATKRCAQFLTSVRPDPSLNSGLKAALSPHSVRPDSSLNSGLKAALSPHSVRPELVEGSRKLENKRLGKERFSFGIKFLNLFFLKSIFVFLIFGPFDKLRANGQKLKLIRILLLNLLLLSVSMHAYKRQTGHKIRKDNSNNAILLPKKSSPVYDRTYYNSLIKRARKRRWAITVASYYDTEDKGFDCNGNTVPLSTVVFGSCPITIEDIYLFSRLSNGNKVRIDNCNARAHDRGGVPIGGTGVVFGGFSDDLYTTLLAPIVLNFQTSQKTFRCDINGIARFDCPWWEHCSAAVGFTVPLKSCHHELALSYSGGELFRWGFVPDTTQRETSLKQFFREFSSVEDFINSAVLAPYCLSLRNQQQQSGIGDISFFGLFEYHHDHTFEAGLALVLPTASKGGTLFIWEPTLGSGGAYVFNPFVQLLFSTNNPYFNPFVRIAAEVGSSFNTSTTRAPTLVTNLVRQQVHEVSGLSSPDTFENFYVDPFQEYDSTVPLISGKTPTMRKKGGSKVLCGLGNYLYDLFPLDFRFGMFYDFFAKGTDSYCATSECTDVTIDTASLEAKTNQQAHILSANLIYKFKNYFELGLGGQYTIYGKNIAKNRGIYFSFVSVF